MNSPHNISPVLKLYNRLSRFPVGRRLFGWIVGFRVPYVRSIRPYFLELRPRRSQVAMKKRRAVQNHLKGVHVLAIGNLCEIAAGLMMEVTVPPTIRWIPRNMFIEYLKIARSDLKATAEITESGWSTAQDVPVPVSVRNTDGEEVVRATINMYLSPKGNP